MRNNLSIEIILLVLFKYLAFYIDTDEIQGRNSSLEESFKPLQVGITNPTPSQPSGNISPSFPSTTLADDGQRTSRPTSSNEQRDSSPKTLPSLDTAATSAHFDTTSSPTSKQNQAIQNLPYAIPIAPVPIPPTTRDYEQGSSISSFAFMSFQKSVFLLFRKYSDDSINSI